MAIKTLQDFGEALQRSMDSRGLDVTVTPMTPQKGNKGMQKRLFLTPPPSAPSPPTSSSESPNTQADG
jgi:hypothetical protein